MRDNTIQHPSSFSAHDEDLPGPTSPRGLSCYSPLPPSSPPESLHDLPIDGDHDESWADVDIGEGDITLVADDSEPEESGAASHAAIPTGPALLFASGSDPGLLPYSSPHRKSNLTKRRVKNTDKTKKQNKTAREEHVEKKRLDTATFMQQTLDSLQSHGISFGDLFLFALDSERCNREWIWTNLFKPPIHDVVPKILNVLASTRNSNTGRRVLNDWAIDLVSKRVYDEGAKITKSGMLRVARDEINVSLIRDVDVNALFDRVRASCPVMTRIQTSFATTNRQQKSMTVVKSARKHFASTLIDSRGNVTHSFLRQSTTSAALSLLSERSWDNIRFRMIMGLWLYANGASRQSFSILRNLNLSVGYATLMGRGRKHRQTYNKAVAEARRSQTGVPSQKQLAPASLRHPGVLELLSQSARDEGRQVPKRAVICLAYDNLNKEAPPEDQTVGRTTDSIQNGTTAYEREILDVPKDDMQTIDLLDSLDAAPILALTDIDFSAAEQIFFDECLAFTVLRIVIQHGGEDFKKFRRNLREEAPSTPEKARTEKTVIRPLPTMQIDESSTVGNAEVITTMLQELELDMNDTKFVETLTLLAGDQLSMARARGIAAARAGVEGDGKSLAWIVKLPGLFHYEVNSAQSTLSLHLGKPNHEVSNPGSLLAHNAELNRKLITPGSTTNFRTTRNLIFVSLYARVLHCMLLVSGKASLEAYAADATWDELKQHARMIVAQYANGNLVEELRDEREFGSGEGDMLFENAVLFMRDALILREFADAIKVGDGGRVFKVIQVWTYAFQGAGRTNYANEALELVHHAKHVWTESQRKVILPHLFVNPSGEPSGNIPLDLEEEFLNNRLKNTYAAHGGKLNFWDFSEMIAPISCEMQNLNKHLGETLGAKQNNSHAMPDLTKDIAILMDSVAKHELYTVIRGRALDPDNPPVVDVIAAGRAALAWGKDTPLDKYNANFRQMQERRRRKPLTGISLRHARDEAVAREQAAAAAAAVVGSNTSMTENARVEVGNQARVQAAPDSGNNDPELRNDEAGDPDATSETSSHDSDVGDGMVFGAQDTAGVSPDANAVLDEGANEAEDELAVFTGAILDEDDIDLDMDGYNDEGELEEDASEDELSDTAGEAEGEDDIVDLEDDNADL